MNSYRPLPDFLRIGSSRIDGQGLITLKRLLPGLSIGITHVPQRGFQDGYVRTPLGGFINHEDEPNCKLYRAHRAGIMVLQTQAIIHPGGELTVKYGEVNKNWSSDERD